MRNGLILAVVSAVIGFGIYADISTHQSKNRTIATLEARIAAVERSRAEVLRMYTKANELLTQTRLELAKANKELTDAIQSDEASRAWASQPIPPSVQHALRNR